MRKARIMAFVCQICPVCVFSRKYPASKLARASARERQQCPFCKAYDSWVKNTGNPA